MEWTNTYETLRQLGTALAEKYRQNLTDAEANASYALYDSVTPIIETDEGSIQVSLSLLDYWKWVEYGTDPGHFPPVGRIRDWINVKPVIPRPFNNGRIPTPQQLAFLISRKIFNEGIEGRELMDMSIREIMETFKDRIEDAITRDVMNNLDEILLNL